ncbi:unnamed protein product, partial [Cuscuta europaea]
MSDAQLQQLLVHQDGRFYQQHDIPDIKEEFEDEDMEEEDPATVEHEQGSSQTPDDDTNNEDEAGSSQPDTSLGISGGYDGADRHIKARRPVEYAKLKDKGKQTQISRFASGQPY